MSELENKIRKIRGPILVLGASGFIGANLLRVIRRHREDVFGTILHLPAWRLEGLPQENILQADLLVDSNLESLFERFRPQTVINCVAYGAYSFETQSDLIFRTNFNLAEKIVRSLAQRQAVCYLQAGSSSEYGENSAAPAETQQVSPNSDYAVSKAACAALLDYYGKKKGFPCANLRLYSAYGPQEDSSRLIPAVIRSGVEGRYPEWVDPDVSRDFVFIDDIVEAFVDAAVNLPPSHYGESFNIGSGKKTTIAEVARLASEVFKISDPPRFRSMPNRHWDLHDWYADARKAKKVLGWEAKTPFPEGFRKTVEWYKGLAKKEEYLQSSKKNEVDSKHGVSAIVACYKDAQAIPIMYQRLKAVFEKMKIDHEIIFVNDNSPDDSENIITELSGKDSRVIGISHSRNFGSQAAFRSGLEMATQNACVLLDGDLQDPPEVIEKFVEKWREGFDVVYGSRVKREAPWLMQLAYKFFYRVFQYLTYFPIPRDAGDFSLIDRRVVKAILRFPERDFFLRGVRGYVGFRQCGVDYVRPERVFGKTTNNFFKNVGWAKKALFSFSYTPLNLLSFAGVMLFFFGVLLLILQVVLRLLYPELAPKGFATVIVLLIFFSSINLFALAVMGEYIAKIFEEVKQRPPFIRKNIIKDGEVRIPTEKF